MSASPSQPLGNGPQNWASEMPNSATNAERWSNDGLDFPSSHDETAAFVTERSAAICVCVLP